MCLGGHIRRYDEMVFSFTPTIKSVAAVLGGARSRWTATDHVGSLHVWTGGVFLVPTVWSGGRA